MCMLSIFAQISRTVFAAGQIGLDPARMVLVDPKEQPSLSLTHTWAVIKACHAHLNSALCGICYFTTEEAAWRAREAWKQVHVASPIPWLIPNMSMLHAETLKAGNGPREKRLFHALIPWGVYMCVCVF